MIALPSLGEPKAEGGVGRIEATQPQGSTESPHISNPKREPLQLFLAESGLRETDASIALVGCVVMQYPEKVASALEQHRENLLLHPYLHLPAEEKRRLQRQGFVPGADGEIARNSMLQFLTAADFDIFAFYAPKSQLAGDAEAHRSALFTKLLQSRLAAKKWPAATLQGRYAFLPSLSKSVGEALRKKGLSDVSAPEFRASAPIDFCLMIAEYACAIIRTHIERLNGGAPVPGPDLDFERIRTKVRMVNNIVTSESFHRKHPLP